MFGTMLLVIVRASFTKDALANCNIIFSLILFDLDPKVYIET